MADILNRPQDHASSHHHHSHDGTCCGGHGAHHDAKALDPTALISARGLCLSRGGMVLLDRVDIDIHSREIVTVIGPNGAGKTTLVRALLGIMKPDRGSVLRKSNLCVGYVPQRFDIDRTLPMTVERFLMLGHGHKRGRVASVLAEVSAEHVMSRQMSQISGGELQRVALARALLADPELLVLDEPARGVDFTGEAELYRLIGRLRDSRGLGVILVSHDLHIVMAASDRVICINRHVCCSGVPEAVAQDPEYARLFGPDAGRAFAIYQHHHDHRHDLAGAAVVEEPHASSGGNGDRPPEPGGRP